MPALTAPRETPSRSGDIRAPLMKGGVTIYRGAMVAIDADRFGVPAGPVAAHKVIGRAEDTYDNSAGADGGLRAKARTGVLLWGNAAADAIAVADIGALAYVVDDNTVAKTSAGGARPVAGVIFDVDPDGVWVRH